MQVPIINHTSFPLPEYKSEDAAGMDLMANPEEDIILNPMDRYLVPTGIHIALPRGYEAQIRPRSGLSIQYGITVVNAPVTIDADYRGEIKVPLINLSTEPFTITKGMRIAQMVVTAFTRIEWQPSAVLDDTERGSGGFGHTGV